MKGLFTLLMLVIPHSVFTDSHCLALISTFIKGDTPFPELSATLELDDLTVAYFDFEKKVFFSREPHKEEEVDTVVDPETVKTTLSYLQDDFEKTWIYVSHELNVTERIYVEQKLVMCGLMDNDRPGPMIIKSAIGGSTADELYYHEGNLTYQKALYMRDERLKQSLTVNQWRFENLYYPACIKTLRAYLQQSHQVKREDSHSLVMITTYIKGDTPFPEFSFTFLLDDLTVAYYDSEKNTLFSRDHHKEEEVDTVVDQVIIRTISSYMQGDFEERRTFVKHELNLTERIYVEQRLVVCELMDNDQLGPMITKNAIRGSTADELYFHEGKITYQNALNIPTEKLKQISVLVQLRYEHLFFPTCIKTLKTYLKQRSHQVKRKVKPRVRLIQKKRSVSGWDGVSCLATGFYPRHINLTILRDGEPVPERLTTGGELLPNGDGTYQMRKNLELSGEDLKQSVFTCSVTHLGLDNKLDVHLELGPGEPLKLMVIPVLVVVLLLCVVGAGIYIVRKYRRRKRASPQSRYSAASSTEESETSVDTSEN